MGGTSSQKVAEPTVFAVGTPAEIGHHIAPLASSRPVKTRAPEEVLAEARPGDLAIFYSEHFDRFRDACCRLRKRKVATLYLIDGILEWRNAWDNDPDELACPWTMRPALSHKIACIGHAQARVLASWGNADKVEVVGVPRFDRLLWDSKRPSNNGSASRSQPSSSVWRVLVATAKCPGYTRPQLDTTCGSLKELRNWFASHPSFEGRRIEVVWRLTGDLADRLGVDNAARDLSGGELVEQLHHCDALITTPSTAMLEGMALGLPVALLDYHITPSYCPAAWTITAGQQIAPVVRELMAPPPHKWWYQQWLFRDALYQGEPATDRLNRLIDQMLHIAQRPSFDGTPLQFPPCMLGPGQSLDESWEFCAFFPQVADIAKLGIDEAHREWAHARREIERLNARIHQLQSELAEAHRIFDSIHKHPVAGPVVRLRQRWRDWLHRMNAVRRSNVQAPTEAET